MIISVSAMLLISVLVGKMLNNKTLIQVDENQSVNIVQIDFPEMRFNLVDGIWTCSDPRFEHERITKMIKRWKALLLRQGEPIIVKSTQGKTVLIYLESVTQPIVVKLYLNKEFTQISFMSAKQEFKLNSSDYSSYYPSLKKLN